MEPNVTRIEQQPESAPDDQAELEPASPEPPFDLWSGAAGALIAIAVSGLLILGLWLVSRDAPSAATDPRLLPTPTSVAGTSPFGDQMFVTVAPEPAPQSTDPPAGGADDS